MTRRQVKPGKPDALFISKRTRRKLSSLRRASGNLLEVDVDQFYGIEIEEFPALSESMLALLGISHAGYLANKAVTRTPT